MSDLFVKTFFLLSVFQLPLQSGKACLGDNIYRLITDEQFSTDCLLDCLDLSSDARCGKQDWGSCICVEVERLEET